MTEELEIQEIYQETVDKMLNSPPEPSSFMQGFMILSTLKKVLAKKGLSAEIQINIVNNPSGVGQK